MNNIFIFSQPIRSGKTTALMQWIKDSPASFGGFLTPDIDDMRKLYDVRTRKYYDLQVHEESSDTISIGRFIFDNQVFKLGKKLIEGEAGHYDWLIVDEVGKLEIETNIGWEPALRQVIERYKTGNASGKLLLVIRDYLLDLAKEHYGLQDAAVINKDLLL